MVFRWVFLSQVLAEPLQWHIPVSWCLLFFGLDLQKLITSTAVAKIRKESVKVAKRVVISVSHSKIIKEDILFLYAELIQYF